MEHVDNEVLAIIASTAPSVRLKLGCVCHLLYNAMSAINDAERY
jgi:hypothetical protein